MNRMETGLFLIGPRATALMDAVFASLEGLIGAAGVGPFPPPTNQRPFQHVDQAVAVEADLLVRLQRRPIAR